MRRFKNILCVVADDCVNEVAIERATALARNNQAHLTIVRVIDEVPTDTKLLDRALFPEIKVKFVEQHHKDLQELVAPWKSQVEFQTKILTGISFLEVVREVLRFGHDLVIKAADNDGFVDRVFGSNDMHISRKCPCPLWLDNSEEIKTYSKVVAAVDVDDCYSGDELETRHALNLQILEMASSLARSESAELHIVVAYEGEVRPQREHSLNVLLSEAVENIPVRTHLLEGVARKKVPALTNNIKASLLVMGTVARTGIPGFIMGNTAETIQNQIKCSLLAIKPPGFVTPVTIED